MSKPSKTANKPTSQRSSSPKMFSFLRKSSKSPVMAHDNGSETTLVSSTTTVGKGEKPKNKPKRQTEPYQAEFSGLSSLGGMPSLGGHMFLPPPSPTKESKMELKMVPAQPLAGKTSASVVNERLHVVSERDSFETFSPTVTSASADSSSSDTSSTWNLRKLTKTHKSFFNNAFSNT